MGHAGSSPHAETGSTTAPGPPVGSPSDGAGVALTVPVLGDDTVTGIAETLQALATPSRLRILLRLRESPCSVGRLADAVGMEQSAVSHQLRVLRHLGWVSGHRQGRHVSYRLHDDHVAALLAEAIHHAEHLRLGRGDHARDDDPPDDATPGDTGVPGAPGAVPAPAAAR